MHLFTIKDHLVGIRDFKLNVQQGIAGTGAGTIVFLHDSLGCNELWRDFPQKLAAATGYNYMMYDRRGYGRSSAFGPEQRDARYMETEAVILAELLDLLQIEHPILFGHSNGGTIALLAASCYPGRFKALLTEGAHVFVEEITLDGIVQVKEQYRNTNLGERLAKYHGERTPALFDAWTETWLAEWYRDWDITALLPAVACPVMVIQGTEDEFGSAAQVEAIATGVSGRSQVCMVVHAGHSPHKQNEIWLIHECALFIGQC